MNKAPLMLCRLVPAPQHSSRLSAGQNRAATASEDRRSAAWAAEQKTA
ncbi:hypothetical protein [Candidatus Tokpelaia sp.]|nr:hypothetical protein [Candidatus Tokpelaia sp.]